MPVTTSFAGRALVLLLLAAAASAQTPAASGVGLRPAHPGAFTDQTAATQIVASYMSGTHGFLGGGGVGDFDRDGWQDVFYPAGGNGPDMLYINRHDGTFADEAAAWGVATTHESSAAAVGDYDGDGWLDIHVSVLGPTDGPVGPHKLYRNDGGTAFLDVSAQAGVDWTHSTRGGWGGAWGDYDLDGDLDLAVSDWMDGAGNRVFRNDGDGTFTDVTTAIGFATAANIVGFAVRFIDVDEDRYPEVMWIGDFGTSRFYENNGDGTFTDATVGSGTSLDGTEMGQCAGDVDEDGLFDFYVTTIGTNNLYINQGDAKFFNHGPSAGVEQSAVGWGAVAIDFNHDTRLDLIATSGSGNYAFRNVSTPGLGLLFEEVSADIGMPWSFDGRGLSSFDYDNDGDLDLIVFPHNGAVRVFRNEVSGLNANWLRIFLDRGEATDIAPDGIGAVVEIDLGPRTLRSRIDGGSNYMSQSELSAHLGLGGNRIVDELRVLWPNGEVTTRKNVRANRTLVIQP